MKNIVNKITMGRDISDPFYVQAEGSLVWENIGAFHAECTDNYPHQVGMRKGLNKALGGDYVDAWVASPRMENEFWRSRVRSRGSSRTRKDFRVNSRKSYRPWQRRLKGGFEAEL